MKSKISKIFVFTLLLTGAGCTKGPSSRDQERPTDDYSCEFKFNEGARVSSEPVHSERVQTHFGKRFDRGIFNPLMKVSAQATVEYVESSGVHIYRVDASDEGKCTNFKVLPQAPDIFQTYWYSSNKGGDGMRTTGMYVARDTLESSRVPTILVRRDSNRWTVLHEFLHHLMAQDPDRRAQLPVAELTTRFTAAMKQMKIDFSDARARAQADAVLKNGLEFLNLVEQYMVRSALEEVTIESLLREELSEKRLGFVPDKTESSKAYIAQSASEATSLYEHAESWRKLLEAFARTQKREPELSELVSWAGRFQRRQAELGHLSNLYGGTLTNGAGIIPAEGGGSGPRTSAPVVLPCQHRIFEIEDLLMNESIPEQF